MRFISTLGGIDPVSFEEAVLTGFTRDGGILMPEALPQVDENTLSSWKKLSYVEIVKEIVCLFVTEEDMPHNEMKSIIDRAFHNFDSETVAPIHKLRNGLGILELFHGPTLAFKDYALCCLTQFMNYFLTKRGKKTTIIVATSGDTGSAAIEAVRDLPSMQLFVLYPRGRVSEIQELQMVAANVANAHVIRARGTSDDLDVPLKTLSMDKEFSSTYNISSINSINFGRILVQIAHYFYAYLQMATSVKEKVRIIVPSGALGNITGGCMARSMGLQIELVMCTNANDVCHEMVQSGSLVVKEEVIKSLSCAMDIQLPYNISRLLWLFSGWDTSRVRDLMSQLDKERRLDIPKDIYAKLRESIVDSIAVDDKQVLATMRTVWNDYDYLVCPHTACALAYTTTAAYKNCRDPRVVIATASPAKFVEAVQEAGLPVETSPQIKALRNREKVFEDLDDTEDMEMYLRRRIEAVWN